MSPVATTRFLVDQAQHFPAGLKSLPDPGADEGEFHRAGPNHTTWPSVLTENRDQRPDNLCQTWVRFVSCSWTERSLHRPPTSPSSRRSPCPNTTRRSAKGSPASLAQGDTGILHCHWLPLAVIADMNLRSNLAVIAVIFCRNDSAARG